MLRCSRTQPESWVSERTSVRSRPRGERKSMSSTEARCRSLAWARRRARARFCFQFQLLVHQQGKAFLEAQLGQVGPLRLGAEGLRHAHQTQGVQLLQRGLIQHKGSFPESKGKVLGATARSK